MAAPVTEPVVVASHLQAPWDVVFYEDTPLVSLRDSGEIVELNADGDSRVAGTVDGVQHRGEGGLLGLAVGSDGLLYAYLTTAQDNRIVRYELEGTPGALALGDSEIVIDGLPSAGFHNGGRIAFGPDGMLYAGVGDAGNASAAQDPDLLNGKILRMTPDGDVPADNPIADSYVYSLGHRNVQGLGWTSDGRMIAAEFGQDTWDELNVIEPGSNYGWPEVEGMGDTDEFVQPVQVWRTDDASPSGLAIVADTIFIAGLRGERLIAVPADDLGSSVVYFAGRFGRLRTAVGAPDGSIWILTNNTDGRGEPGDDDDRILSVELG